MFCGIDLSIYGPPYATYQFQTVISATSSLHLDNITIIRNRFFFLVLFETLCYSAGRPQYVLSSRRTA